MKSWLLLPAALCTPLLAQEQKIVTVPPVLQDVKTAPLPAVQPEPSRVETLLPDAGPIGRESVVENARTLPRIGRNQVLTQVDADGTVWVRGANYKASFGNGKATYIPFLGSRAPQNYPVDFQLARVSIGGQALAFDANASATLVGNAVEIDRGAFVERYVLAPDSIEQTFVFETLEQAGEIVVTIGVESSMASSSDAEGFRFANALGHVRYGRAFAVDQAGMREALAAELVEKAIEIRLPASVVARASMPLVIDPVVTSFTLDDDAEVEFGPDTSYDGSQALWATVYEEAFSASDHDISAIRHSSSGTIFGEHVIDISTVNYTHPRIANNNIDNQFMIAAARGTAPNREIYAKTLAANGSSQSVFAQVSGAESGDKYNPDIGGDPAASAPTYYCVVWERDFGAGDTDIHARLVDSTNTTQGGVILLENSAATLDREPAISSSNGLPPFADQNWNIVWVHRTSATNDDLQGARIHWNGDIEQTTFSVAATSENERAPSVSCIRESVGGERAYAVAYQLQGADGDYDIRVRAFVNNLSQSTLDLPDVIPTGANNDQTTPSCDTDGKQFVVAYRENTLPTFFSTDLKVVTLYMIGTGTLGLTEGPVSVAPGSFTDVRPELHTRYSAGITGLTTSDDVMVVYDRSGDDIFATYYDMLNSGPISSYCAGDLFTCPCANVGAAGHGCANSVNPAGGLLTATGASSLESDTLTLTGSDMPGTATCLYFQGTSQTNGGVGTAFGDGLRCASGTVVRLATKTNVGGTSSYPSGAEPNVSVRGMVPAAGAIRYYQGWYRNSASYCTSAAFNLTNGVRVVWIP